MATTTISIVRGIRDTTSPIQTAWEYKPETVATDIDGISHSETIQLNGPLVFGLEDGWQPDWRFHFTSAVISLVILLPILLLIWAVFSLATGSGASGSPPVALILGLLIGGIISRIIRSSLVGKLRSPIDNFLEWGIGTSRNQYMAQRLHQLSKKYEMPQVLAIVGKSHVEGIKRILIDMGYGENI